MKLSTSGLVLAADAPIDLQTHTILSDGKWTPEALVEHLSSEGFGLAAVTDHDRADTVELFQKLAVEKQMPLLVAVEMTTLWKGEMTDILCYGFDPEKTELRDLALDVARQQRENTLMVVANLREKGNIIPNEAEELAAVLETPSAQQPHELAALLKKHGIGTPEKSAGSLMMDAGFAFATTDPARVVEVAHHCGAICLIAHPGRGDGFPNFDEALLDEFRAVVPIDGFEAYYPLHSPEQVVMYLDYARKHDLLTSAGSDSHDSNKLPIKYPARESRKLLERLGIQVKG